MNAPTILSKAPSQVLASVGLALLRVKTARHITLEDMGTVLGRTREMVSQYIAGEAEMGMVAWLRANAAWPELAEKLAEAEKQS